MRLAGQVMALVAMAVALAATVWASTVLIHAPPVAASLQSANGHIAAVAAAAFTLIYAYTLTLKTGGNLVAGIAASAVPSNPVLGKPGVRTSALLASSATSGNTLQSVPVRIGRGTVAFLHRHAVRLKGVVPMTTIGNVRRCRPPLAA